MDELGDMLVVKIEPDLEPEAQSFTLEDPLREDVVNHAPNTTTPLWEQVDQDCRNKHMIERAIKSVLRRKAQSEALSKVITGYNENDGLDQHGSEAAGSELSWPEPSGSDALPLEPMIVLTEPKNSQTWRRTNKPLMAASASPPPSASRLELDNFLNDSGSDDNSGHETSEEPGVTMKEAACRLRDFMVMEPEDEEVNMAGAAGGEDVDMDGAAGWWYVNENVAPVNAEAGRVPVPDLHTFTWSENFAEFTSQEEVYARDPGPKITSADPLTIFLTIWDVTILERIAEQTNLYAWQVISALSEADRLPSYLDAWVDTTVDEIRRLFAMFMLMALDYRARVDDYWTTGVLQMPAFRKLISRNRFQMLLRFLHFTDNYSMPPNLTSYEKKIFKVKELHDYVVKKFCELYTPSRELALDETLLLWKGRLSWMQCVRSKASRFGIKSFELCESSTGYLLKSLLYAGKNSSTVEAVHGFDAKASKVVLELMDGFLDLGHLVVMDSWYNQLPLTRYLKHRRTDVLGTLKKNTAHVPNDVKNANPNRMQRGQQIARHCGDVTVTAWKDVQVTTVVSTCHGDAQVLGRRGGQVLMMPVSFQAYTRTMGGVDLKDTKLSSYPMERKRGKKWYMKVFLRLLNTSILNSHIIHTRNSVLHSLDHRDFRVALVQALIEASQPAQAPRQLPLTAATRLDGRGGHHPVHTELQGPGKREKYQRRRCKRCSARGVRAEVSIMCAKCGAPLCIGQCWIDYHTLEQL